MIGEVRAERVIRGDPERVFAAMVEPASQNRWVLATTLYELHGAPVPAVGSRFAAFTGAAGIGILDVMTVTEYDRRRRCVVRHDGGLIRGTGTFEVEPVATDTRAIWAEHLELPFGVVGRVLWPAVKPLVRMGLWLSLRRLSRLLQGGMPPIQRAEGGSATVARIDHGS